MSTRIAQLSVTVKAVRSINFSLKFHQDLGQCWLEKTKKIFSSKSDPSWCSVSSSILSFCWVRRALKFSEEKGSCVLPLYHWFFKQVYKNFLLLLMALPGLIGTLFHSCQLLDFSIISITFFQMFLMQKYFHSIPSLTWTLTLYLLFCLVSRTLYSERKKNMR